jgi:general secretion pathway protein G
MICSQKKNAFTLMEVMIAIVIIGILATLAGPAMMRKWKQIEINTTRATMSAIKAALNDYREDIGHFPTKEEGGLEALVKKPKNVKNWNGPSYLEGRDEVPKDKWGQEFDYNKPPKKYGNLYRYYEIISDGPEDSEEEIHLGQ